MIDDDRHDVVGFSFASSDIAAVEDHLGRTYTGMSIGVSDDPSRFSCRHDAVAAGGMVISRLTMPVSWSAALEPMPDQVVIEHLHRGGLAWRSRDYGDVATAAGSTVLAPPSGAFGAVCDHIDVDIIGLDAPGVAEYAEHVSGVSPDKLSIFGLTPISERRADRWVRAVAYVRDDVLGDPFASRSPIAISSAFRQLSATMLSTFPNTALARVTDPGASAPRGAVPEARLREVVDYLTTHAGRPIGPRDIAELAGVPAREVVAGLRRRRDVHPAELLWKARLVGARRDLLRADPGTHSDVGAAVAGVAARWGFTRAASFRLAFAREFDGDTPEHALQRFS